MRAKDKRLGFVDVVFNVSMQELSRDVKQAVRNKSPSLEKD